MFFSKDAVNASNHKYRHLHHVRLFAAVEISVLHVRHTAPVLLGVKVDEAQNSHQKEVQTLEYGFIAGLLFTVLCASSLTGRAALRSELPSLRTGLTALPSTLENITVL